MGTGTAVHTLHTHVCSLPTALAKLSSHGMVAPSLSHKVRSPHGALRAAPDPQGPPGSSATPAHQQQLGDLTS